MLSLESVFILTNKTKKKEETGWSIKHKKKQDNRSKRKMDGSVWIPTSFPSEADVQLELRKR